MRQPKRRDSAILSRMRDQTVVVVAHSASFDRGFGTTRQDCYRFPCPSWMPTSLLPLWIYVTLAIVMILAFALFFLLFLRPDWGGAISTAGILVSTLSLASAIMESVELQQIRQNISSLCGSGDQEACAFIRALNPYVPTFTNAALFFFSPTVVVACFLATFILSWRPLPDTRLTKTN